MNSSIPTALLESLRGKTEFSEKEFITAHESPQQVTSIRLNPYKPINLFTTYPSVPWTEFGKYLEQRPSFISDPLFHAGCYYVQEASSMFLEYVVKQSVNLDSDIRVLDLCAAPGGKSTLLSSILSNSSLLVSNEIIKSRVPVLSDNLTKWGPINTVVTNNDPKDFSRLADFFDLLVIDAPCSGSGMFRKDPAAIDHWSENNVELCSQRQQRILADSLSTLKKDGILIYSTCSYSYKENEEIADWICDTFDLTSIQVPINKEWEIVETVSEKHKCYGYRFYPQKVKGEGFFISCFRKNEGNYSSQNNRFKTLKIKGTDAEIINGWINGDNTALIPVKDGYSIINKNHESDIQELQSKLYLKKSGVFAGRIAGKELIPDHELALSLILSPAVQRIELSNPQALSYLRRDELKIESADKGWGLMCTNNFGLGWAKILPNRINNYYPKEMRILKEF
ncbi:methyltransferase RsmF C-terminal domain-like protein [Rubrolithibacter danxiaensis]|uniref:methyltransferase RsmF C-terminal domain-like protein n=1 Tax=Rubrolithibacter danxiaensis TaxID=3390805 RepID=UPI003BF7E9DE